MRKKTDQRPRGNPPDSSSQTLGLIAKDFEPGHSAGAEPVLDNLSHRTPLCDSGRLSWRSGT